MNEFIKRLRRETFFFLCNRSLLAVALGALVWPGLIFLLDTFDKFYPIQEKVALDWILTASVISALTVLSLVIFFWMKRPNSEKIAQATEKANPNLMDLFNCALELNKKSKQRNLSYMENRVLAQTEKKVHEVVWGKGSRPNGNFWLLLGAAFAFAFFLSLLSSNSSPIRKALDSMSEEPGLDVFTAMTGNDDAISHEATMEFSSGTDVSIFADVTRGHRGTKDAFIEFHEDAGITRMEMLTTPILGRFEFIVPALQEVFAYRVVTSSLEGEWNQLSPYDPPALKSVSWTVDPPHYTGLESFVHEGFGYQKASEGSFINLKLEAEKSPPLVNAVLKCTDGNHTLKPLGNNRFQHSFDLSADWTGRIELSDPTESHRAPIVLDDIVFSMQNDDPPLVEISQPAKDLQLPADARFLVEVFAADDYGISDVRINVSHAGEKTEESIFVESGEKETNLTYVFDLNEKTLAVGDVLTYMALAMDNKEPEGQVARSEIYFIEVLPPEGNSTEGSGGEGDMQQKEIPVRDFINKTKTIIRSTYDALIEEDELARERSSLSISADALSMKHEMTKVYDEFEGAFPIVDGIDSGELLNEATYHIEQTEIYAGDLMLEESLEPSEETLRKLVQLYALMRKMDKQKQKQKKQSELSEAGEDSNSTDQDKREHNPFEELDQLAEDLKKLDDLEERQNELNTEIGRAAGSGKQGDKLLKLAKDQEEIRRDLMEIRDQWYDRTGKLDEVADLDLAEDEMKGASEDLRRNDPRDAEPHGDLAANAMNDAKSKLEQRMAGLAASMVDQLSERADELAKSERMLEKKSEEANPGQGETLKDLQDQLNSNTKNLLEDLDQMARSMGRFSDNAMEDLLKGARRAREDGIEASGKRASNALLYERYEQAGKEQSKLAENLESLDGDIGEVADKLRNTGNQALKELVEKLVDTQQSLEEMNAKDLKSRSGELAEGLKSLSGSDPSDRLKNLTDFFDQVANSESPERSKSMAAAAVFDALDLVEQFFWQEAKQDLLRRNQASTAPPSRYKRQVEEYFRRIAEGK